jgi:hypothetical protein
MKTIKKQVAAVTMAIWLLIVIILMVLSESVNLEFFFILWMIGMVVILELIEPRFIKPRYILKIKYIVTAGFVVFCAIVVKKVLEIIQI